MSATDDDVNVIAAVARALVGNDADVARAALAPIAGQTIATHPVVAFPMLPR